MKTFPEGVTMEGSTIKVAPESSRVVVGAFEWRGVGVLPAAEEASGELAKIAKAAGGNELVVIEADIDRGYLRSAKGIVIAHREKASPQEGDRI